MRAAVRRAIFPRQFSPLDLGPGVVLAWWSADRDDTFTRTGGSPIVSWRDCVGGLTLTQSVSGSRPTWSANSFGGAPCVVFDGTDDELTLEAQPFPSAAGPVEMWAVASQAALAGDSSTRQLFGYGGTSNATRRALARATGVTESISSAGVGVRWYRSNFQVSLDLAKVIDDVSTATGSRPVRLNLAVVSRF